MDFLKNIAGGDNQNQQEGTNQGNTQEGNYQGNTQEGTYQGNTQEGTYQSNTQNNSENNSSTNQESSSSEGGFLSGISNKLNSAAGGGVESEKNEDMLDKGIDFFQEKVLGQGPQDNESAFEQAKDEQISDFLRGQYKTTTGSEFPVEDKPTKF